MRKELVWLFERNLWLARTLKLARFYLFGWRKRRPLKLNIGCGFKKMDGFINIDAFENSADVIMDALDLRFDDNSADHIESHHLIEHLTRAEGRQALEEWFRVLKPGGKLVIECPDLTADMKRFLDSPYERRWSEDLGIIVNIYGEQTRPGLVHKSGYDFERMSGLMTEIGYVEILSETPTATPDHCIRVVGYKPGKK